MLVLDEADEMLDMGFAEDIDAILEATPEDAADGAVLGDDAAAAAGDRRAAPARARAHHDRAREDRRRQDAARPPGRLRRRARAHKAAALQRVLDIESPTSALVFCRTRLEVDTLVETLNAHGYRAEALHGGMQQRQRDTVMGRFRAAKADLLIATDVAARGLDIEQLSHVFNYDVPSAPEVYVHRIGRTGRAGREGTAITLAEPREHRLLRSIERLTKQKIDIATLPTVADLRAKRLELTRASIRERLVAGDFDDVRVVVESLARGVRHRRRRGRGGEGSRTSPMAGDGERSAICRRRPVPREEQLPRPGGAARARRASGRATTAGRWPGSSSAPAARPGSGPPISSARSPTKPGSRRATSARSRSPIASRWWKCPKELVDDDRRRDEARRRCAGRRCRSGAIGTARSTVR